MSVWNEKNKKENHNLNHDRTDHRNHESDANLLKQIQKVDVIQLEAHVVQLSVSVMLIGFKNSCFVNIFSLLYLLLSLIFGLEGVSI